MISFPNAILSRSHWVFDLDGTLTVAVHDFAAIRALLGIPDGSDILEHLSSLTEEEARPLHARLHEIETELSGRTSAAEGAIALMESLAQRGVKIGVLTRNTRVIALMTLEAIGIGRFFREEDVLGRNEALPKPDPEGIVALARRWGVEPASTVMVGDYLYDLMTGRAAGAATVHVDTARSFRWPELTDLAVGSLAELAALLPQEA